MGSLPLPPRPNLVRPLSVPAVSGPLASVLAKRHAWGLDRVLCQDYEHQLLDPHGGAALQVLGVRGQVAREPRAGREAHDFDSDPRRVGHWYVWLPEYTLLPWSDLLQG